MPYTSLVARDVVLLCFPPVSAVFSGFARRAMEATIRHVPAEVVEVVAVTDLALEAGGA